MEQSVAATSIASFRPIKLLTIMILWRPADQERIRNVLELESTIHAPVEKVSRAYCQPVLIFSSPPVYCLRISVGLLSFDSLKNGWGCAKYDILSNSISNDVIKCMLLFSSCGPRRGDKGRSTRSSNPVMIFSAGGA